MAFTRTWDLLRSVLASWILRAAITAGLIGLLVALVDFPAAVAAIGEVSPLLFLASLAIALGAWLINSVKWWLLLRPLLPGAGLLRLWQWNLRGIFYGQILPGLLAGEAVKGYRLYRETGSARPIIVSIGADRLTGLAALVLLGSLAFIRSQELRSDAVFIGVVIGLGLLVPALLLAMFTPAALGWIGKLKRYPWLSSLEREWARINQLYQGRYPLLATALLLALAFQALGSVVVFLLAREIGIGVGLIDFMWVYAAVSLVSVLPLPLGGLGPREATLILLLRPLGVDSEAALTLGLLILGTQLAMALLGGGLELREAVWPPSNAAAPPAALVAQPEGLRGWTKDA